MSTPVLQYGDRITQEGVVCATTPDGLRIIVPDRSWLVQLDRRVPIIGRAVWIALEMLIFIIYGVFGHVGRFGHLARALGKPPVEVEVTRTELVIIDRRGEEILRHRFPRGEVGEFRLNRFEPAIWIRVPGKDCGDALCGLNPEIQRYIIDQVTPLLPRCVIAADDSTLTPFLPDNGSM